MYVHVDASRGYRGARAMLSGYMHGDSGQPSRQVDSLLSVGQGLACDVAKICAGKEQPIEGYVDRIESLKGS